MISVHFQGKPFNITVIQVYAPISNAEEAEVEWFYEDLQDLLELREAQLASIFQMSGQVSRGSAGENQADEQAGVTRLSWRLSGR